MTLAWKPEARANRDAVGDPLAADRRDPGKRIWSLVSRQSAAYLNAERMRAEPSGLAFVWAWDLVEVPSEIVNYRTPRVTFQWMIDERRAILI